MTSPKRVAVRVNKRNVLLVTGLLCLTVFCTPTGMNHIKVSLMTETGNMIGIWKESTAEGVTSLLNKLNITMKSEIAFM
jgi:hypothetical protein